MKYTQNTDYVATGLRELLEYMTFVKRSATDEYVESADNLLESVDVKGLLFVDELSRETPANRDENVKSFNTRNHRDWYCKLDRRGLRTQFCWGLIVIWVP